MAPYVFELSKSGLCFRKIHTRTGASVGVGRTDAASPRPLPFSEQSQSQSQAQSQVQGQDQAASTSAPGATQANVYGAYERGGAGVNGCGFVVAEAEAFDDVVQRLRVLGGYALVAGDRRGERSA